MKASTFIPSVMEELPVQVLWNVAIVDAGITDTENRPLKLVESCMFKQTPLWDIALVKRYLFIGKYVLPVKFSQRIVFVKSICGSPAIYLI